MKYALLIYGGDEEWESRSEDEQKAIYQEYFAISEAPGTYGGAELQPAQSATTVRVRDGETMTTDGPFAETKEVLGGFYLFEADNLDDAIAVAARIPAAKYGAHRGAPAGGALTEAGLPRGVGPRARGADRLPRRLRPRRGSRAGGVRDRGRALAARRHAGQPRRLARHDGAQPCDRPDPSGADARSQDPAARRLAATDARRTTWTTRCSPTSGSS